MASEDSDQIVPGFPSIHRLSDLSDFDETGRSSVRTTDDELDTSDELLEVLLLRAPKRMPLEERDHRFQQVRTASHDVAVQVLPVVVIPVVDDHLTHSKELTQLMEAREASFALRDHELVSHLISGLVAAPIRPTLLPNESD